MLANLAYTLPLRDHNYVEALKEAYEAEDSMSVGYSSHQAILGLLLCHELLHLFGVKGLRTLLDHVTQLDILLRVLKSIQMDDVRRLS